MDTMFKIYTRGIIINSENKVLLIKKALNQKIAAGKWILPGGTVEFGEDVVETLRRELKEEVNFDLSEVKIRGTRAIILEKTHWLGVYYSVIGNASVIQNLEPHKHSDMDWFAIADLPFDIDQQEVQFIKESV